MAQIIEETTEEASDGIFSLKGKCQGLRVTENTESKFILTTEVEDMKRVHHLIIIPSLNAANR